MKKILYFVAAAFTLASCAKEIVPQAELSSSNAKFYPVTVNATVGDDASKLSLDGLNFKWNTGDKIFLRCAGVGDWEAGETAFDTITATQAADSCAFNGEVRYIKGKAVYMFQSATGHFIGKNASQYVREIASTQTGKLEDIQANSIFWSMVKYEDMVPVEKAPGDTSYFIHTTMNPFFSLIKFNVAEALDVRKITISGSSLTGTLSLSIAKTFGTIGATSSNFMKLDEAASDLVIDRGGEVISGDVYALIIPDAFDTEANNYYNSTTGLKITFTNSAGLDASVSNNLSKKLMVGQVKNLGSVSNLSFSKPSMTGSMVMLKDPANILISVKDTLAGSKFYYEIGAKGANDPTVTSAQFYASTGFAVPEDNFFDTYYIKILVKAPSDAYADLILKGYLRSWQTVNGCGILNAYNDYLTSTGKESLTKEDDNKVAADGLYLTMYNDNGGKFVNVTGATQVTSGRIYINCQNINTANCFYRSKAFLSSSQTSRTITFSINGSASSEKWSVPSSCTNAATADVHVWDLGSRSAGTEYHYRASTTYSVCSISLLETSDDLEVPTAAKEFSTSLKFMDSAKTPTIVIDTARVGTSVLAAGAKFYYTSSMESFDAVATPTTSDTEITAEGFPMASSVSGYDRLYVKVLAKCEGCEDSYLKVLVRGWQFGKNYQPEWYVAPNYDLETGGTQYVSPSPYNGLSFSPVGGINKDYTTRMAVKAATTVSAEAELGGTAAIFCLVGSCTGGTTLTLSAGGSSRSRDIKCSSSSPVSFAGPTSSVNAGGPLQWVFSKATQPASFAALEQCAITPM